MIFLMLEWLLIVSGPAIISTVMIITTITVVAIAITSIFYCCFSEFIKNSCVATPDMNKLLIKYNKKVAWLTIHFLIYLSFSVSLFLLITNVIRYSSALLQTVNSKLNYS